MPRLGLTLSDQNIKPLKDIPPEINLHIPLDDDGYYDFKRIYNSRDYIGNGINSIIFSDNPYTVYGFVNEPQKIRWWEHLEVLIDVFPISESHAVWDDIYSTVYFFVAQRLPYYGSYRGTLFEYLNRRVGIIENILDKKAYNADKGWCYNQLKRYAHRLTEVNFLFTFLEKEYPHIQDGYFPIYNDIIEMEWRHYKYYSEDLVIPIDPFI